MADMNFRTSYEAPLPKKQVAHYIRNATSAAERKVWRDMLNGPEYHKAKNAGKQIKDKKEKDEPKAKGKKK